MRSIFLSVSAMLLTLTLCFARAETVQGDLDARFADAPTIEYAGETYRMRNRLTTMLALGLAAETDGDEAGVMRVEFAGIVVIDDDTDRVTFVAIDCRLPLGETTLRAMNERANPAEMDYGALLAAVNEALPGEWAEHYIAIDIDALASYDTEQTGDRTGRLKNRLKALAAQAEAASTDELSELLSELSDSIFTDMRSGALVKAMDKAERYETAPTLALPYVVSADEAVLTLDESALTREIVDVFYQKED